MLFLLSPSKDQDPAPLHDPLPLPTTSPALLEHGAALAAKLRALSQARLCRLMDISPKLALLNHARWQQWGSGEGLKTAVHLFSGEAYRGLDAATLDAGDLTYAQGHLRILSGLYGVLRPLDLITPYRLEMATRLATGGGRKDLYAFWGGRITDELNATLAARPDATLVNLASAEYFRAVRLPVLRARVVTPVFKEQGAGGLRTVNVIAKRQRGAMCRWAIQQRVQHPEQLKDFTGDGYRHQPKGSTADAWLFTR